MNTPFSILPPPPVVSSRLPKVGDILVSCWGYDQTNADFYEVVAVTGKSVHLFRLEEKETPTHPMFGRSVPVLGSHRGVSFRRLFRQTDDGYRVRLNSYYSSAGLWDGQPVEVSHTH